MLKEDIRALSCVCDESCKDRDRSAVRGAVSVVEGRRGWFQEKQEQDGALSASEELGGPLPLVGRQDTPSMRRGCPVVLAVCSCSPSPAEAWLLVGTTQIDPARAHGSHGVCEPPRVAEETSHVCAFCDPVVFNSLTSICGPENVYKPQM